jgi:hypothetical protein
MTEFRRTLRYHQAQWREEQGYPVGSQPIVPRPGRPSRLVGSRLPLDYARETGANFFTRGAIEAVQERTARIEPHQSFDHQRLWAELLWSPALAFNLFGDLAVDSDLADHATRTWWPDAPGTAADVRFVHSPGWLDPAYLNSLRAFDAAIVLDIGDGTQGIVGIDSKYHERAKAEIPRPTNVARYLDVAEKSHAFLPGATDAVKGKSELCTMWLEHLLVLSMLQHPSGQWSWGRYVVVYPAGNSDIAGLCSSYTELLADPGTFSSVTLEELLEAGALPPKRATELRRRYVAD